MIAIATLDSPVGPLTVAARADRVCLLHFGQDSAGIRAWLERWYPGQPVAPSKDPAAIRTVLGAYFTGDVDVLDRVPVELNGTAFQKRVWEALRGVRAGTTVPYATIAKRIAAPHAVRAVGAANGANPVAVIVPCHRIIGSNGTLTGYGGGLERKEWLLRHEGVRTSLFV